VGSEDSVLKADLEKIYAFTHKERDPRLLEYEVPAKLDYVNCNPRACIGSLTQKDTDQANRTATAGSGKLVVSEVCISPWIANVSLSMRVRTPDVRVFICACLYLHPPKLVPQKLR
jgi:hypothetical protein